MTTTHFAAAGGSVWMSCTQAGDGLHLRELVEAEAAPFAAVAGLLVAAEGCSALVGGAVDVDVAGADALGDAPRALHVAGGDIAGEPVGRVVSDAHGVVLVLVA